jgi:hypothetical protein
MGTNNIIGFSKMDDILASLAQANRHKDNPAEWVYERLVRYIREFEQGLDNEHEIGARLVSFGSIVTFHIQDLGYFGPDIICFSGQDENGQNVQLIQNIAQLNVLLIAMKKVEENPRRIGFNLDIENDDKG